MNSTSLTSKWDEREIFLYYFFLKLKYADFQSYSKRKSARVFDYFSHLVSSKSRFQVKSYHHNLMKRFKSIGDYLENYESEQNLTLEEM